MRPIAFFVSSSFFLFLETNAEESTANRKTPGYISVFLVCPGNVLEQHLIYEQETNRNNVGSSSRRARPVYLFKFAILLNANRFACATRSGAATFVSLRLEDLRGSGEQSATIITFALVVVSFTFSRRAPSPVRRKHLPLSLAVAHRRFETPSTTLSVKPTNEKVKRFPRNSPD